MDIKNYNEIFYKIFEIIEINEDLSYGKITEWDSIGHMKLISEIEEYFDIMMDPEDIINFKSYKDGLIILEKYDIIFSWLVIYKVIKMKRG